MTYYLRNRHTLEEKLGRPVLVKLFELVRKGSIQKSHVKDLSYDYNLNLYTTYTRGVERDDLLESILEDMLDAWCDQTLGSLSIGGFTVAATSPRGDLLQLCASFRQAGTAAGGGGSQQTTEPT